MATHMAIGWVCLGGGRYTFDQAQWMGRRSPGAFVKRGGYRGYPTKSVIYEWVPPFLGDLLINKNGVRMGFLWDWKWSEMVIEWEMPCCTLT